MNDEEVSMKPFRLGLSCLVGALIIDFFSHAMTGDDFSHNVDSIMVGILTANGVVSWVYAGLSAFARWNEQPEGKKVEPETPVINN